MSEIAFQQNCLQCSITNKMRGGKLAYEDRPCPKIGKNGKRLNPGKVRESQPKDWKCEERRTN